MMATRNPKVVPKRKPSKPQAKSSTLSKEQAWTDTDDTEGTKESGESSDQTKGTTPGELQKGSLISVREADETNKSDEAEDEFNQSDINGIHEVPQTTDTEVPQTTDTEGVNGTETDSLGSMESGARRRVKRNAVVPTDGEDSGRQTPDVESRKDAWSIAETDADVESNAASSRPSSAHHRARQRPATAVTRQPIPVSSVERPMTAPTIDYRSSARPGTSGSSRPKSTGSRPRSRGEEGLNRPASSTSGALAITDGGIMAWEEPSPDSSEEIRDRESSSSRSSDLLAPPQLQGEQNAYIPYIYAKDCIQRVMDDMKKMKSSHVKVVDQIQDQYKSLEDDIQAKFNTFVLNLRNEYSNKVTTFRQVITIHREDSFRTNTYWQDTVKSLQSKNQVLLNEKRQLLIKNREEFTKLEQDKVTAVKDLTRMLDERHAKYTLLLADFKGEQEKVRELEEKLKALEQQGLKQQEQNQTSHEEEIRALKAKHEEEVNELKQQLELVEKEKQEKDEAHQKELKEKEEEETKKINELTEKHTNEVDALKAEIQKLQEEIDALKAGGATVGTTTVITTTAVTSEVAEPQTTLIPKEERQEEVKEQAEVVVTEQAAPVAATATATAAAAPAAATVTVLDNAEKERLTQEIAKLQEEIDNNKTEAVKNKEELDKEKERILNLEEEVSHLGKEKTRFEKQATDNKQELRETRQQCTALREQLQGLLAATAAAGQVDDKETEEKLKAAEVEKQALVDEQSKMKEEFEKWKEQYRQDHEGEEPTEDDRSEEVQAMMEKLKQEEEKLKKAENAIAVMTMLKEGTVPETVSTAGVADRSSRVEELEDRVSQLEAARDELEVSVEKLTKEKEALEEKVSEQEEKNKELTEKNAELEEKVKDLEKEVEDLRNELDEIGDGVPVVSSSFSSDGQDVEGMSSKLAELEEELAKATSDLELEKAATSAQIEEIEALKKELASLKEGSSGEVDELKAQLASTKEILEADIKQKEEALAEAKKRIEELEKKLLENVPIDTAEEIGAYQEKLAVLQKDKEKVVKESVTLKASVTTLTAKVETLNKNIAQQKETEKELQDANKKIRADRVKELKDAKDQAEAKSKKQIDENNKKIQALQKRIKELEAGGMKPQDSKIDTGLGAKRKDSRAAADLEKVNKEKEKLQAQVEALKKAAHEDHSKIKQLEKDVKEAQSKAKPAGPSAEERAAAKKQDKQLKELQKNLDMEKRKFEKVKETLTKTEEELKDLKKEHDALIADSRKDKDTLSKLEVAAQEGLAAQEKVDDLTKEVKALREENKSLSDNYNSERILRKKYYNMVEDMKGKIRVYCRARPLSGSEKERGNHSVIKSPDEYTVVVETPRGPKDFQYDQVFTPDHGQEKVFEDTNNLIQSAVDGYNVCIFAYGQTGSGKTYTMIGDKELKSPGIAPRAMTAIFSLMDEQKSKFSFKVHCYMLELYNDKLIDLLAPHGKDPAKLDIKKDKKGLVFVQGSVMTEAATKDELWSIFEKGSENRHVASTKMNAESSRSHLILGIVIESTNLTSGAVVKGKISLVDLAGSERAAKTGATAEQLKEAQSINKSLSALGDVISALSSEQQFIPYRNNKLTMLMQDSLGGNAKTLMFVNISPADYNTDETVTSLTYASRVKLITNDAQKNSENKEINRLKAIIAKLKKGESVDDADIEE